MLFVYCLLVGLVLAMAGLKLAGRFDRAWSVVLLPLWGPLALALAAVLGLAVASLAAVLGSVLAVAGAAFLGVLAAVLSLLLVGTVVGFCSIDLRGLAERRAKAAGDALAAAVADAEKAVSR